MQRSKLLFQRAHRVSLASSRSATPPHGKVTRSLPRNDFTTLAISGLNTTVLFKYANPGHIIIRGTRPLKSPLIGAFSTVPTGREAKTPAAIAYVEVKEATAQNLPAFKKARVQGPKAQEHEEQKEDEYNKQEHKDKERKAEELEFEKPENAELVSQLDLSARLSAGKTTGRWAGFRELWRLLSIAKGETKTLTLAFCFLLVSSTITIAVPSTIGKILDQSGKSDGGTEQLLFGLDLTTFYLGFGGLLLVGACATYGRIITLRIIGERIVTRLRSQLFRQTYSQNAEFFDANRTGDLISRLGSDTIIVGKSITQNLSDGLRSIVSGAAGIAAMAYVSLKLTAVLAIIAPPVAIGSILYGRIVRNISRKIQDNLGTLTKIAEERLGNVRTSQAFAGEILEVARYNKQTKKIFKLGVREGLYSAAYYGGNTMAGNMAIVLMLYIGSSMVKTGQITIGELTSFLMYTAYAGSSLVGLSNFYSELMKGVGAATRLFEMQDRKPTISPTVGVPVKSARGPIRFENVTFSYPTRPGVTIFNNLDFEIPQGSNVAIVGPSGGGKSTISSLLLRFYTPSQGSIKIDGIDVSTMNIKSLRRRIGLVAQEPVLFSGTIAENISYGKPHATRPEIIAAARQANCQQFIGSLPDGLETPVGARGTQLSGGQKQRIAIARALIKNPDILILDEATSALDAESETLVNSALSALLKGNNTTISIAHRLSTIKRSDTIIVLSADGQVAEQGPYKELSKNPHGAFTKLMEWQMTGSDNPSLELNSVEGEGVLIDGPHDRQEYGEVVPAEGPKKPLMNQIPDERKVDK